MENIQRVFIHELGHFVANEINLSCYGGSGTEAITIFPCKENPNIFCGGTTPVLPLDTNPSTPPPIERLAQNLVGISYGCIFQAYYQQGSLSNCFRVNGCNDFEARRGFLSTHKLNHIDAQLFKLSNDYLEYLLKDEHLHKFINIDISLFLDIKSTAEQKIDIQKLKDVTSTAIENHKNHYDLHVQEHQKIIDSTFRRGSA
ncbi:MAG: hypothetical protein H0X33_01210 [Taibaiella sp.]|nr:hypothetical protein [Taibaiella sp.]